MSVDWKRLNAKTAGFRALDVTTGPDGRASAVVFRGLEVKLSEIAARAGGPAASLAVFADTLIVDVPAIEAQAAVIMARSVELGAHRGALPVRLPPDGDASAIEFVAGGCAGGALALVPAGAPAGAPAFAVPTGTAPLSAALYLLMPDRSFTTDVRQDAGALADVLGRPGGLASLRASFTAATWLLASEEPRERATAQSMLAWVVSCCAAVGRAGHGASAAFAELHHQAAALLVTLNVAGGASYVPVLSRSFYAGHVDALLTTLQSYENAIGRLDTAGDVRAALQAAALTLAATAKDEAGPLRFQLDGIERNVGALNAGIRELETQFIVQQERAATRYALLVATIQEAQALQFFEAAIKLTLAPYKIALDLAKVETDPSAAFAALETVVQSVQLGIAALGRVTSSPHGGKELVGRAEALLRMQSALKTSLLVAAALFGGAGEPGPANALPAVTAVALDPDLAWNAYVHEVEAELSSVQAGIGGGTGSGGAQAAANQYLAGLLTLAEYGKAIDAKYVTLAQQLAEGAIVRARIVAAEQAAERWRALERDAKSEREALAAMKSLLQSRADAVKASVFAAWTYYREAYFYLYFRRPPIVVDLDMDAARLKDAFAQVALWIARLLGQSPGGEPVQLPNEKVAISFVFPIVRGSDAAPSGGGVALLTPASATRPASIAWSVAAGDEQLAGVLPDRGQVAVWIKEAKFFVEGARPNAKGRVLVSVATSGSYENGFGPSASHRFVTQALSGDYAYKHADGVVYDPWEIDTDVYMTPSPFTQWHMTFDPDGGDPTEATQLRMDLVVAYRRAER